MPIHNTKVQAPNNKNIVEKDIKKRTRIRSTAALNAISTVVAKRLLWIVSNVNACTVSIALIVSLAIALASAILSCAIRERLRTLRATHRIGQITAGTSIKMKNDREGLV